MKKHLGVLALVLLLGPACSDDGDDSMGGGSGGKTAGSGGSPGTGGRAGSGGGAGGGSGGSMASGGAPGTGGRAGSGGSGAGGSAGGAGGSTTDGGTDSGAGGSAGDASAGGDTSSSNGGMNLMPGVRTSMFEDIKSKWVGERRSIKDEGGTQVFTGVFPAGQFGGPNGHTIRLPLKPAKEYIFEYRIRFDGANFPFTRGGKIPGLAGGNAPTGCVNVNPQGFSARMMWRGGGGDLVGYIYDQTQSSACGNNITTNFSFNSGAWHTIKERVRINNGNAGDGILQIWADGRMVIDRSNMRWMGTQSNNINTVLFHTFFGGSTAAWAPSRQCSVSYADVFITLVE